jgi:hypothetical protein
MKIRAIKKLPIWILFDSGYHALHGNLPMTAPQSRYGFRLTRADYF